MAAGKLPGLRFVTFGGGGTAFGEESATGRRRRSRAIDAGGDDVRKRVDLRGLRGCGKRYGRSNIAAARRWNRGGGDSEAGRHDWPETRWCWVY